MSGQTSGSHLPAAIIFHNDCHLLHKVGIEIACLFAFFPCTDGTRGGALEVRDFKKRAKEGMRSTLSCLWTDELVYNITDLAILYAVCIYVSFYY